MYRLRFLSFIAACGILCAPHTAQAQGNKPHQSAQEPKPYANVKNTNLRKELTALDEAAAILAEVKDERSAKDAYGKIYRSFRNLPPILGGNHQELEMIARAQNRVSSHMWRLMKEPYFEKAKLQEAWTLMTDPFSRELLKK